MIHATDLEDLIRADLILTNAEVITMDPHRPRAEAVAVRDGIISAVGAAADMRAFEGRRTKVIDLHRRALLPGFIDSEQHPEIRGVCECDFGFVNARYTEDKSTVLADIARKAAARGAGEWVKGNDGSLRLTRRELDAAAPRTPVAIWIVGLFSPDPVVVTNSAALELAEIGPETPDPPDGRIHRDGHGPTGVLEGTGAIRLLPRLGPLLPTPLSDHYTPDQVRRAALEGARFFSRMGITTLHNLSLEGKVIAAYMDVYRGGRARPSEVPLRMNVFPLIGRVEPDGQRRADAFDAITAVGVTGGWGSDMLRIPGVKIYCDGSMTVRSAAFYEPYRSEPRTHGSILWERPEFTRRVVAAHRQGLQVAVHAHGDRAIDFALDAFEEAQRVHPRADPRHRIQHCTICPPAQQERIRQLGVIPVIQPVFVDQGPIWRQHLGEERTRWFKPIRSFLDRGIHAAGSSDYGPYEPLKGIQAAVTRSIGAEPFVAEEGVTLEEALALYTINGARAAFEEERKGSVEVGKLADFVVLDRSPYAVPPSAIARLQVETTVVGGVIVHERDATSNAGGTGA